jgi:peptidylprolyl isomerase
LIVAQAKDGDQVRVHYTGKFTDGKVFDSSVGGESLQFTVGAGQLIAGFDSAVVGMQPGESKTVLIPALDAYGLYKDELVFTVERQTLPSQVTPAIGQRYQIRQEDGSAAVVIVTAVSDTSVTLDGNHELAGKDLSFEIQLVEIL